MDNPPSRTQGIFFLNEFLYLGEQKSAYDSNFIKTNQVTHVVNLSGDQIVNIYDGNQRFDKRVK